VPRMMRAVAYGLALVCLATVMAEAARAQPTPAQSPFIADSSADPFLRYATPGQCKQAAARLLGDYWRTRRYDTVTYAPLTDSVPKPVATAIQRCAARFTIETVPTHDLLDLVAVYLWTGQDTLAQRAVVRLDRTEQTASAAARGAAWYQLSRQFLLARPVRRSLAQAALARLDAMGAPAARWRLLVHLMYARLAMSWDDRSTSIEQARAAIVASRQMARDDRIDWADELIGVYSTLATSLATTNLTAARAVFDTADTDVSPLRPTGSGDQQRLRERIAWNRARFAPLGLRDLPQLHASAWYGIPVDTLRPRHRVVSLFVFANASCGAGCYPSYAVLRRLSAEFRTEGLDIVLLANTHGYYREQPMSSPSIEADSTGAYLLDFLHLPATVVVETTTFTTLSDGRRSNEVPANQQNYPPGEGAMLIDADGVVRWVDRLEVDTEATWRALIRVSLTRKTN